MHCLRSLGGQDRRFESHSGYGRLVFVCVYVCVRARAGRSLATS
jgi:hypothetical protein